QQIFVGEVLEVVEIQRVVAHGPGRCHGGGDSAFARWSRNSDSRGGMFCRAGYTAWTSIGRPVHSGRMRTSSPESQSLATMKSVRSATPQPAIAASRTAPTLLHANRAGRPNSNA